MVDIAKTLGAGFGLGEQIRQAPQRDLMNQLGIQQAQQTLTGEQARQQRVSEEFEFSKELREARIINQASKALKNVDPSQQASALERLSPMIQRLGVDPTPFQQAIGNPQVLDQIIAASEGLISDPSKLTASMREFQSMTAGLSPEDKERARRIELGLDPRAVGSGAITTATTPGLPEKVAVSEAEIAGAKEGAKLTEQLKLKPEIEAAVKQAVTNVATEAAISKEERSNSRALNTYQVGMSGLAEALGATTTGPFFGLLPAMTADQQIADGAIAAMAPILKSLFRTAGEGTFTDKDQELLLNMIPTRKDKAAAREAKFQNIDAIVKAKLGGGPSQSEDDAALEWARQNPNDPRAQRILDLQGR